MRALRPALLLAVPVAIFAAGSAPAQRTPVAPVAPPPTGAAPNPEAPSNTTVATPKVPELAAFVSKTYGGADHNRCVPDVAAAVNRLRTHGDPLGFHFNGFTRDLWFLPTVPKHWQGIQRLAVNGTPRLVITRGGGPMFAVAEMGSRGGGGSRLRSNRITPATPYPLTVPPATDKLVFEEKNLSGFDHAGGAQLSGKILAVPLESSGDSKIRFYVVEPSGSPQPLPKMIERKGLSNEAGAVAFTKIAGGLFVVAVGRADSEKIDFYVSNTVDAKTTSYWYLSTWSKSSVKSKLSGDSRWGAYQSINFVSQCDGKLFLVGTHNDSKGGLGDDWVDAYLVDNVVTSFLPPNAGEKKIVKDVTLTKVAKRHLHCSFSWGGAGDAKYCNLDAAGGVYVDPEGELIVYSTTHTDSGPNGTMNMMEFRSVFPNPKCSERIGDAFVELYDDSDFSDRGIIIDNADHQLRDYKNYDKVEGFEDKASSVRWCMPPGYKMRLWEDKSFKGKVLDLKGRGERNLKDAGWNDKVSSSQWDRDP